MFEGMEYMYAVYEERSFSKAAKRLFISQPSLSATVKRIEERIGYPVFDRSTKPLQLTEFGKEYIRAVEQIRSVESQFTDFVGDWGDLQTGRLVLGGSNLFSSWVLPALMSAFSRRFPQVRLELKEESTPELAQRLQDGKIDLLLDNCELDETVFESSFFREEHLLLAVPEHCAVNRRLGHCQVPEQAIREGTFHRDSFEAVSLSEFAEEPFIMLKPENDTRKRAEAMFRECGLTPRVLFELDQQMTSYNITCSGMGISFVSDTLIERVPFHGPVVFYRPAGGHGSRNICFYRKRGRYFSRAMKEFLEMAQNL